MCTSGDAELAVYKEQKVVWVKPFFSKVYVDEEMKRLSSEYDIWQCDGEIRGSTLGKAEIEALVARILALVRVTSGYGIILVGVKKAELETVTKESGEHWFIEELIRDGYLRERKIWDKESIVFPTEKLLENQGIPKRCSASHG